MWDRATPTCDIVHAFIVLCMYVERRHKSLYHIASSQTMPDGTNELLAKFYSFLGAATFCKTKIGNFRG